jgi:hypothetical protein
MKGLLATIAVLGWSWLTCSLATSVLYRAKGGIIARTPDTDLAFAVVVAVAFMIVYVGGVIGLIVISWRSRSRAR